MNYALVHGEDQRPTSGFVADECLVGAENRHRPLPELFDQYVKLASIDRNYH
jgi:hypothetical protein